MAEPERFFNVGRQVVVMARLDEGKLHEAEILNVMPHEKYYRQYWVKDLTTQLTHLYTHAEILAFN